MRTDHLLAEKRRILQAALPNVAFDGWTGKLLRDAAAAAGYDAGMALRAFPGGAIDLLDFYAAEADRQMLEELESRDLPALKVRERIAAAVRVRLEQQAGHREAIRRALAVLALPHHAATALRTLYRTVDAIWYAAGDSATDFNFYTKRLLLAGVYSATVVYWLDDRSPDQAATWQFLDRRLGDVMRLQGLRGRLGRLTSRLPNPLRPFRRGI